MIPDLFANQDGEFVVSLLLSRIGLALLYMIIAVIVAWIVPRIVQRSVLAWAEMRYGEGMTERRHNTIARLMRTLTKVAIFAVAAVAVLSLFVDSAGLFTFLGLFTAAIGFSLRGLIGDYISGFIFLFEDLFAIGDHVEVGGERGTVEDVTMRTTMLRAASGETRLVPNGEIRTVYNYSRATHCEVTAQVCVPAGAMDAAFDALEGRAHRLPIKIPQMSDAPRVLVENGVLESNVTIVMRAQARAGTEDEVRRRMMAAMQETLAENDIQVGDGGASA